MFRPRFVGTLAAGAALALAGSASQTLAQDSAPELIRKIEAMTPPVYRPLQTDDRAKQQAAIMEYLKERQKFEVEKAGLIGKLFELDPKNEKLGELLPQRWTAMASDPEMGAKAIAEIDEVLAGSPAAALEKEGLYYKAMLLTRFDADNAEALTKTATTFTEKFGDDPRAAGLLLNVAMGASGEAKLGLLKTLTAKFPDAREASMAKGMIKQSEGVGKVFAYEFNDATTGKTVSNETLKGKVVVIDFWATWCGPCLAEMPNMKKLYAEYKDKGVEFVGVSLDQGVDPLKSYVAENKIEWPQYFDGKVSSRDFATEWGIAFIPTLFIVDAEGKLHSVEARGKLETLIPELLEKAGKGGAGE